MNQERETNHLLNQLVEGTLRGEERAQFIEQLRNDRSLREDYYYLLAVDLLLAERYEMPDYIAVHAKAMDDDNWAIQRNRRGRLIGSLIGAAAIVTLTLTSFLFFRGQTSPVAITRSADAHLLIDGSNDAATTLGPDQLLELKQGSISLKIGDSTEAIVDAPARLLLRDKNGQIELTEGNIFFNIPHGGQTVEVHTPSGIIRDIGTQFGVTVHSDGHVETHVAQGSVEIERPERSESIKVTANHARTWSSNTSFQNQPLDLDRYTRKIPALQKLFDDDFNAEPDTFLDGHLPKIGHRWFATLELNPTILNKGKLDTSYGPRTIVAGFRPVSPVGQRAVYLFQFQTLTPENTEDKPYYLDAAESISVLDQEGSPLFSLVARASREHRWQLKDPRTGRLSIGTRISAFDERSITLSYERETGTVRFFDGESTASHFIDQINIEAGAIPTSIVVSNAEGGDLALDHLSVSLVNYPQKRRPKD